MATEYPLAEWGEEPRVVPCPHCGDSWDRWIGVHTNAEGQWLMAPLLAELRAREQKSA